MKNVKKLLSTSLLAVASILAMASCGVTNSSASEVPSSEAVSSSSSQESSSSEAPANSSSSEASSSSSEEKATSHSVTFQADADHPNTIFTLYNNITSMQTVANGGQIKIGTIFAVEIDDGTEGNSTVRGVKANGISMTAQTSFLYKFQMPDEDVIITVDYDNPDVEYTLTYNEDASHPATFVSFYDGDPTTTGKGITTAKKGQTVYAMTSYDPEKDVITGVYFNGTLATQVNPTYEWMLTSFTMPEENVVVTVSYQGSVSEGHSITYQDSGSHANTFVNFAKTFEDACAQNFIVTANAGDTVFIYVQNMDDDNPTKAVKYNGNLATIYSADYGWMLSTFVMPDEDVTVTVEYENDGAETTFDYTLSYVTDTENPTVTVSFGKTLSQATAGTSIAGANENDDVYVYIQGQEKIITGVYYNGTLATRYSESGYGWSVVFFTMPAANVVITITYQTK